MSGLFIATAKESCMTRRFSLTLPQLDLSFLGLCSAVANAPQYNIAPRAQVQIVRQAESGALELTNVSWGLVPAWLKDLSHAQTQARAETLAEKPMFKSAFAKQRCLILTDGYYEWRELTGRRKQPYRVSLKGGGLFCFAGLWERYPVDEQLSYDSCALITVAASSELERLHPRMPLILRPADYQRWLDPASTRSSVAKLLQPLQPGVLRAQKVSTYVNDPSHQGPECCRALS